LLVPHCAVLVLPLPLRATAAQPLIVLPPSVKATVPVGALPLTVAVNVTLVLTTDGFAELANAVLLVPLLTACESALLLEAALPASPLYAATMLCVPAASAAVLQAAGRVFPLPVTEIAAQPEIEVPPSVKFTVPVGLLPVTAAVNVTFAPTAEGLAELASVVLLAAWVIVCVRAVLVEPLLDASPVYAAVMLCDPDSATAAQPPIELAPSRKFTVPVGDVPLTVAVKVTLVPKVDGVSEVVSPVVLDTLLTVCDNVPLLDAALPASPL
jgi:hypothetical protein